jgi:hypothetical protein
MNIPRRAPALAAIASLIAIAGCNSTQPDRIETRVAAVSFSATGNLALFNCYDVQQDTNGDGVPDTDLGMQCNPVPVPPGAPPLRALRPVPWRYSIKITVIPGGSVNEQVVKSTTGAIGSSVEPNDLIPDFESLTDYDPDLTPQPDHNDGVFFYTNGHQVSEGSPVYLSYIGSDPGMPNILDTSPSFNFNLNTGDTVIVRVRKQSFQDSPGYIPRDPDPQLQLVGALQVSGVAVAVQSTPPVAAGDTSPRSSTDDQGGITFSYSVR